MKEIEVEVSLAHAIEFTEKTQADEAVSKLAKVERRLAASNVLVMDLRSDLTDVQDVVPRMDAQLKSVPFV